MGSAAVRVLTVAVLSSAPWLFSNSALAQDRTALRGRITQANALTEGARADAQRICGSDCTTGQEAEISFTLTTPAPDQYSANAREYRLFKDDGNRIDLRLGGRLWSSDLGTIQRFGVVPPLLSGWGIGRLRIENDQRSFSGDLFDEISIDSVLFAEGQQQPVFHLYCRFFGNSSTLSGLDIPAPFPPFSAFTVSQCTVRLPGLPLGRPTSDLSFVINWAPATCSSTAYALTRMTAEQLFETVQKSPACATPEALAPVIDAACPAVIDGVQEANAGAGVRIGLALIVRNTQVLKYIRSIETVGPAIARVTAFVAGVDDEVIGVCEARGFGQDKDGFPSWVRTEGWIPNPKPPRNRCGQWAEEILNDRYGSGHPNAVARGSKSEYSQIKKACERGEL